MSCSSAAIWIFLIPTKLSAKAVILLCIELISFCVWSWRCMAYKIAAPPVTSEKSRHSDNIVFPCVVMVNIKDKDTTLLLNVNIDTKVYIYNLFNYQLF